MINSYRVSDVCRPTVSLIVPTLNTAHNVSMANGAPECICVSAAITHLQDYGTGITMNKRDSEADYVEPTKSSS